jgi:hypothetical protein
VNPTSLWLNRVLLPCLLLLSLAGHAAVAPHIQAEVPAARLAGEGGYRYFGLKIYDAQLWVGEAGYFPAAPFALELRYARKLVGVKIAEASRDEIAKLGLGTEAQRATWLAAMTRLFPDVQEGSRLTGVHRPGLGARFYLDGKLLGEIADAQFSNAFFAIWLDPKTSAPDLRMALLQNLSK